MNHRSVCVINVLARKCDLAVWLTLPASESSDGSGWTRGSARPQVFALLAASPATTTLRAFVFFFFFVGAAMASFATRFLPFRLTSTPRLDVSLLEGGSASLDLIATHALGEHIDRRNQICTDRLCCLRKWAQVVHPWAAVV